MGVAAFPRNLAPYHLQKKKPKKRLPRTQRCEVFSSKGNQRRLHKHILLKEVFAAQQIAKKKLQKKKSEKRCPPRQRRGVFSGTGGRRRSHKHICAIPSQEGHTHDALCSHSAVRGAGSFKWFAGSACEGCGRERRFLGLPHLSGAIFAFLDIR